MKSTSIHNLNADKGLNIFLKPIYLGLNWVNNLFPYAKVDKNISIRHWDGGGWEREWENTYPDSSAGRKMSDLFWRTLPWDKLKEELGEIHVFDTGCGSGNYGVRLMEASGGKISSYTGIDHKLRPTWKELEEKHPNFTLMQSRSSDIRPLMPPKANLFITQSAIEHFDEDIVFFEQIKSFIDKSDKPVVQIHNFPAAATLPLYLFHGLRQYTPRTVSKITRLFSGSLIYLYGLGGKEGKKLQFKYFTLPVLILRKFSKPTFSVRDYESEMRRAIEYDITHPTKSPLFWVLVIHSNIKNKIW